MGVSFLVASPVAQGAGSAETDTVVLEAKVTEQIATLGEKNPAVLGSIFDLITAYWAQNRHQDSLPWSQKALQIAQGLVGDKHPITYACLNNLLIDYRVVGQYGQAVIYDQKVYQLSQELFGETKPETLAALSHYGEDLRQIGHVTEALSMDEKVFQNRLALLGEKHADTLMSLSSLATDYRQLGRIQEALQLDEKAVSLKKEILGEKNADTLQSMSSLAADYRKLNREEEALVLDQKVLEGQTALFGEKSPAILVSLNNVAADYYNLGRYMEAEPLHAKAAKLSTEILGEKHPNTLTTLSNLALDYHKMGRYSESIPLEEKVLQGKESQLGLQHPATLITLNNLAVDYYIQGRNGEAASKLEKLIDGVEQIRQTGDLSPEDRQSLFAQWIPSYKNYAWLCNEQGQPERAFYLSELTKARTLLELTARRLADSSGLLTQEESHQIDSYYEQINQVNDQLAKLLVSNDEKIALQAEKNRLVQEFDGYRRSLADKYPKYGQLSEVKIVDATMSGQYIPNDAAFISYMQTSDGKLLAFLLGNDQHVTAVPLGQITKLTETVTLYRELMAFRDLTQLRASGKFLWMLSDGSYILTDNLLKPDDTAVPVKDNKQFLDYQTQTAKYLGEQIVSPLLPIIGDKKRWIICPDDVLNLIPFETLMVNEQPLVMQHDISYVQSLSMLALIEQRRDSHRAIMGRKDLLAMGAAYYQVNGIPFSGNQVIRLQGGSLGDLKSSEAELDALGAIFADTSPSIYRQDKATEFDLLKLNQSKELSQFKYLVFSVHGYFDDKQPNFNSILLGQKNLIPGTDGFVTVTKWPSYNLSSDLVYLSACETGRGKYIPGEGMLGLTYALYVAGNQDTIATLWKTLDDESAVQFTRTFFTKLRVGGDIVQALSETKRDMIQSGKYSRPVYWAPFVLYGI